MTSTPDLLTADTSAACPDLGGHAHEAQRDHLLVCVPCWVRWAKLLALVCVQVDERRWSRWAGLPVDSHGGRR